VKNVLRVAEQITGEPNKFSDLIIAKGNSTIHYDTIEDFFENYAVDVDRAEISIISTPAAFTLSIEYEGGAYFSLNTRVTVKTNSKSYIASVFDVADAAYESALIPLPAKPDVIIAPPVIFIGHGRSGQWRDLKDHLTDKHHYRVVAYETGARAGHTIRDILDDMLDKSTFALLVLTAEDAMGDGTMRARQNVIHETGLFQGKLGFSRAIVLLEEGAEDFSNIDGIQQLRYKAGNIKEVFGEVLATLKREFGV
jgi:hypothetical protein